MNCFRSDSAAQLNPGFRRVNIGKPGVPVIFDVRVDPGCLTCIGRGVVSVLVPVDATNKEVAENGPPPKPMAVERHCGCVLKRLDDFMHGRDRDSTGEAFKSVTKEEPSPHVEREVERLTGEIAALEHELATAIKHDSSVAEELIQSAINLKGTRASIERDRDASEREAEATDQEVVGLQEVAESQRADRDRFAGELTKLDDTVAKLEREALARNQEVELKRQNFERRLAPLRTRLTRMQLKQKIATRGEKTPATTEDPQ